jgi:hypothetical protein
MEDKMQIPSRLSHVKCQLVCRIIALFMLGSVIKAAALPVVWINEIHYDNTGADSGEFVEIAGAAGTDLGGYQLVLYNGANGTAYNTLVLSGTIADQQDGFGTILLNYVSNGIQNGAPDGLALVSPLGDIQFLSYEGAFTATGGAAVGITSTDIGVFEPDTSPLGYSLQLVGTGGNYADFVWSAPALASPGSINDGQYFTAASVPDGGTTLGLLGLGLLSLPGFLRRGRLFGS